MTGPLSGRREGRPTNQEGPSFWKEVLEGEMCRFPLHKSKHVVHVEFYVATLVGGVRRDCVGGESPNGCNAGEPNEVYHGWSYHYGLHRMGW